MEIKVTKDEWNSILDEFSRKVKKKEYNRTPYEAWRNIVKANRIEYKDPLFTLLQDGKFLMRILRKDGSLAPFYIIIIKERGI